jgi:hypothetical protein
MYAALWRVLPGPVWVKVLSSAGLLALVVLLLMFVVFPFVANTFLVEGSTLDTP